MNYLFCDTCVLLNLATDIKLYDVIQKLLELVEADKIRLITSDVVYSEFATHKKTIVDKRISAYNSHLKNPQKPLNFFSPEAEGIIKKEVVSIHKDRSAHEKSAE
ncbi:MAG: PIN domain-containing protein [Segetibacter sp.]